MPPTWLTILAWISIAAGFLSAAVVLYDIYGNGLRQPMRVMEAVWPITALYLGPLGLWLYAGLGRPRRSRGAQDAAKPSPRWHGIFISATHLRSWVRSGRHHRRVAGLPHRGGHRRRG